MQTQKARKINKYRSSNVNTQKSQCQGDSLRHDRARPHLGTNISHDSHHPCLLPSSEVEALARVPFLEPSLMQSPWALNRGFLQFLISWKFPILWPMWLHIICIYHITKKWSTITQIIEGIKPVKAVHPSHVPFSPPLSLSPFVRVHCFNLSVWHSHQLQYLRSHKNAVVTRFTPVWTSAYTLWSTCHDATKLQHWPTFLRQAKVEICQGRDWSLRFRTRGGRIDLVGGGKIARMPSRKINGLHSSPTSGCITGLLR